MSLVVPNDERDDVSTTSDSPLQPSGFPISKKELEVLHDPKSLRKLHDLGGIDHLAANLHSDLSSGLTEQDHSDRIAKYGTNVLPMIKSKSFLRLCADAMKDKVLIMLSVAATISLPLGLYVTFDSRKEYDREGNLLPKVDWVESVAIIVAVIIVVVVGAANDYQKERQFARLNAKKEDREVVVIRNGIREMVSIYDLMVGDVISLETGDVIPADGLFLHGAVECDESAITGESNTIKKKSAREAELFFESHACGFEDIGSAAVKFPDPFLISGAKVLLGLGTALVTAVGPNSMHGRTMASLNTRSEVTPLQKVLNNLAQAISKYGFLAALVLFVVLFIRFIINIAPNGHLHDLVPAEKGKDFVDILIVAVTIVVVAVPEGLPLAVTLALAFATTRMAQNGNLVRNLRSCETMGGATAICSDKTGTLTENKMRVVRAFVNQGTLFDETSNAGIINAAMSSDKMIHKLDNNLKQDIAANVIFNSTGFDNPDYNEFEAKQAKQRPNKRSILYRLLHISNDSQKEQQRCGIESEPYLGNKTESALLIMAQDKLHSFQQTSLATQRNMADSKMVQIIPFESSRKWSGVVMRTNMGFRLYIKGAAEMVFRHCSKFHNLEGKVASMTRDDRSEVLKKIDLYADDALRAIMLAHKDYDVANWPPAELVDKLSPEHADVSKIVDMSVPSHSSETELTMDLLVGIQDPLKKGVPEAVNQCKMAGVTVRMVTGDNLATAKAISRSCNILTPADSSSLYAHMEGPQFRALTPEKRAEIIPQLRVLARSSPEDKRILVETLRNAGEVVAVTGDGTNDAPALKLADVGFSMGISGTEVAREASDIILMTDEFPDIVQAIKWGRTVAESIKKFIQFQLTVNITACVLTFVSAVASPDGHSVLTAVQLLWVNLIMDTLAALALATDEPDDLLLKRKPAGRTAPLISVSMWKMIIGQSINQLVITFVLHFAGNQIFFGGNATVYQRGQLDAMTFNTFVWLQFWKLFVTRKLDECADVRSVRGRIKGENLNFFSHLFRNWYFVEITLLIGSMQVVIMFVGGAAFSIKSQTGAMWVTAIVCGMLSLPVGAFIRIIPNWWVVKAFPTKAFNTFIYYVGFGWMSKKNRMKHAEKDLEKNQEVVSS